MYHDCHTINGKGQLLDENNTSIPNTIKKSSNIVRMSVYFNLTESKHFDCKEWDPVDTGIKLN